MGNMDEERDFESVSKVGSLKVSRNATSRRVLMWSKERLVVG